MEILQTAIPSSGNHQRDTNVQGPLLLQRLGLILPQDAKHRRVSHHNRFFLDGNNVYGSSVRFGTNGRYKNRPIYGRVVHKAPLLRVQDVVERNRAFEDLARMYGSMHRGMEAPRRRITAFRLGGGGVSAGPMTTQTGSFQHLKVSLHHYHPHRLLTQPDSRS